LLHAGVVGEGLLSGILPARTHFTNAHGKKPALASGPAAGGTGVLDLGAPELLARLLDRPRRMHSDAVALLHLSAQARARARTRRTASEAVNGEEESEQEWAWEARGWREARGDAANRRVTCRRRQP